MDKEKLNKQIEHWNETYLSKPDMFGESPSYAAIKAAEKFKEKNVKNIIELHGGTIKASNRDLAKKGARIDIFFPLYNQ